jgi:hypothetical protein
VKTLTKHEVAALREAANHPGGWGLFKVLSTERLAAERGYFERDEHPAYGKQWRINAVGRKALAAWDAAQSTDL